MFIDYSQYETSDDEFITRLFIVVDGKEFLHVLIYEFQYDSNEQLTMSIYRNKSYSKTLHSNERCHVPNGSSLTSMTCTNDRITLHLITNQNRSILFLIEYELTCQTQEQLIPLPMDKHEKTIDDDSNTIDDIEQRLNSPGQFTSDMIKEALWITFNLNLDEVNQSWTSVTQILRQLPTILQSLVKFISTIDTQCICEIVVERHIVCLCFPSATIIATKTPFETKIVYKY
jgi:hypothetical protein